MAGGTDRSANRDRGLGELRHLLPRDVAKLKKGAIGLGGVLFLTVTGSAPITAMLLAKGRIYCFLTSSPCESHLCSRVLARSWCWSLIAEQLAGRACRAY
jgi:hypothetical protein